MKHRATNAIEYRAVKALAGLETLSARALRLRFDRHFHETYAFGLIYRGVESCSIHRSRFFFEPGAVPMFNPGDVHDGGPATETGWSYRMVYVDAALVEGERAFPVAVRYDAVARRRVAELFDAIDWGSELGLEEALARALDVLLARRRTEEASPSLAKVRERIDAECCEALRLRDLSLLAGVSATRLARTFERAYGLTPHRYQQSRRIAKAKRMVLAGKPLAEVASGCGYSDQSHLNRWFVRILGTTPGRLRAAHFYPRPQTPRVGCSRA